MKSWLESLKTSLQERRSGLLSILRQDMASQNSYPTWLPHGSWVNTLIRRLLWLRIRLILLSISVVEYEILLVQRAIKTYFQR